MSPKDIDEKAPNEEAPKKSAKGLLVACLVCFILSITTSSGIAYFLIQSSKADPETTSKLNDQDDLIANLQQSLSQQETKIQAIENQNDVLKLYLKHSSATALKNILINQEQNIQAYLKVMKSAIDDLSLIVPRTMDWNNEYQYQLDLAQKGSIEREDLLKLLKTGEPNEKAPQ
ncbi:hypothetical protein [Marinomonas profundimaris]|uniref:Uncharacterized protein n=1 Tax=Marinomonas profundimaris TaxID=1208321 RepID=W1RY88_9GAMM|nr:hypothetical protein [Marinomonas profundimaris]ETI62181.1 hypothetical protein D104_00030 [Marinomonas profundimaris]